MMKRPDWVQDLFDEEEKYWREYALLPRTKKISIWAAGLYRSMRWQAESGLDEYIIYSENSLREILEQEPDFMQMLPEIYNIWAGMFDSEKVDRIIQKHYKKIKE